MIRGEKRNVVVAQSGGPTSVINASLLGVIKACGDAPEAFGRIYGACHGIQGILTEELIDLGGQDPAELALLRTTPGAGAIGTCRYKIQPDQTGDLDRIIEVFAAHEVGAFFYIGGNDSMDTAYRVGERARESGLDLVCVGVPKTIDNDLGDRDRVVMDHTPGYGSVARYWANLVTMLNEENRGSCPADPVLVVQAMGRRIGFIPAAARLADPRREFPLLIALPESGLALEELGERIDEVLGRFGRALVIVSEGFHVGDLGIRRDPFGHAEFGASGRTVAQTVVNYLNRRGIAARGSARGQIPGTEQRHAIAHASTVDLDEAYAVGRRAVRIAIEDGSGFMATIERMGDTPYAVSYGKALLAEMANCKRCFPADWIAETGVDVTDEFLAYARPLIGSAWPRIPLEDGLPRLARLSPIPVDRRCSLYVPQAHRKEAA